MKRRKQISNIDNFDALFVGHPVDIEKNLKNLLPEAKSRENKSIYLQILSQIALAKAMQKKFKLDPTGERDLRLRLPGLRL